MLHEQLHENDLNDDDEFFDRENEVEKTMKLVVEELEKTEKAQKTIKLNIDGMDGDNNSKSSLVVDMDFTEELNAVTMNEAEEEIFANLEMLQVVDFELAQSQCESALFLAGKDGLTILQLRKITTLSAKNLHKVLKGMALQYQQSKTSGLALHYFGHSFKLTTKDSNIGAIKNLFDIKTKNPLNTRMLETLSIIAYLQPCTRSRIESIRDKDPTAAIAKLIELGLVIESGRADTPGRPFLYAVTQKFYDMFNLKTIKDLPPIISSVNTINDDTNFFDTTRNEED